ncbi:MAG: LexA family transcriptional regulator [Clostridia bacterium]|nr:LexA family transcriptional regulator [Clostridia bacterium]MBQ9994055.1 LexA family transcriptional regulator [Clostridia bacterium]
MRKPQTPEKKAEMIRIGKRINEIRREAGLSLSDVAERLNREYGANTNKGMISKYENGIHEPSASTLFCLSLIFGVSCDYLTGKSDVKHAPIPKQGVDTTGYCVKVFKSLTDRDQGVQDESITVIIPKDWLVGGREYFAMSISGRKFAPRYYDGDIVIFERKIKAKKDQVALVSIGGEEAILCSIVKKRDGKFIQPLNPTLETKFYTTEELASIPVKILGVSVELRRKDFDRD